MEKTTLMDWLESGDPAVRRLTQIHLLDRDVPYHEEGWIHEYLKRFDAHTNTWGGGIYGPKWTSTFYTLKELKSLEIDPKHPIYQAGLSTLIHHLWNHKMWKEDDVCVVAMMVSMLAYGQFESQPIHEMIAYLINHHQPDGGWNCQDHHSKKSSVHTTLSVLEALRDVISNGYIHDIPTLNPFIVAGETFLLQKHLFLKETTHEPLFPRITDFHYPSRWFYDVLKALEYFASVNHPYHPNMKEAFDLLQKKFERGYLTKGATHSGRLHFKLEDTYAGRMNTLRGLKVMKCYQPEGYQHLITATITPK